MSLTEESDCEMADVEVDPLSSSQLRDEETSWLFFASSAAPDQVRPKLLQEIQSTERALQQLEEETHPELQLGCELLLAQRQKQLQKAQDSFDYANDSAWKLFEYEQSQAQEKYQHKCDQLKQEMTLEFQRQKQRLENSRDGIAMNQTRRRTTRSSRKEIDGGSPPTLIALSSATHGPPTSIVQEVNMPRRLQERKQLESLLAQKSIFPLLKKQIQHEEILDDMQQIEQEAQQVALRLQHRQQQPQVQAAANNEYSSQRHVYNPTLLQEGDLVRVTQHSNTTTESIQGVITAATHSLVFLLLADGTFTTIDVEDWASGRLTVERVVSQQEL